MVSHPEPDILESEVKWALGRTAVNKASGCDRIPVELFKTKRMMPSRCCIQYVSKSGRSSSGHRTWEFPKKDSTLMVIPLVGRTDTEAETSVFWSSNANS